MTPEHSVATAEAAGQSRRAFCASLCAVIAAAALPAHAQTPPPADKAPDPQPVKLTELTRAEMTPGKVVDYRKLGAFYLAADDRGIFALTAVCTHLGCTVQFDKERKAIYCACHGGMYDPKTGANISGPPPKPLVRYAAQVLPGKVVISRA